MIVFPALANEPTPLNVTDLRHDGKSRVSCSNDGNNNSNVIGDNNNSNSNRSSAEPTMTPGKDGVVLSLGNTGDGKSVERTKLDLPSVESLRAEPAIVKKIAAGLKSCGVNGNCKESNGKCPDLGSLSSGSSIVTICSVTNSEPDPEPDYPTGDGADDPPKKKKKSRLIIDETWYHTGLQIAVPFFIAGIGTIGAGLVLATVKDWLVFKKVSQIFILIPALLGLKGNLDMCLASRLSTQANLGNMKNYREVLKMIIGNIALVQVQAIVAALLVAIFATAVGTIMDGNISWDHSLLLITSSICTATSSCFILDFAMIAVIMGAHYMKMNPDNLATPLAASIGDVVSISVLSTIASHLFLKLETDIWIFYTIILIFFILLPIWICIVLKNKYTRNVLTSGWTPVISALFISGLGGLILDQAVDNLKGFVIFQPIINGIGGNLVSVQASRISTMLHQSTLIGILPPWTKTWVTPWTALFRGTPSAKTSRLLIGMSIPGHLVFSFAADYIQWGHSTIHIYFVLSYLTVAVLQIMLLLYVAHIMIHAMWKYKIDPDNSAIPYLTALGDLTGSLLLAVAFLFLRNINKEYQT
ncbi:PREDICTED: solute carrier family 41 member 1-like [Ceratosolen solmsi marchali]|uniref:Solute carrier family 41 member 1-like n=1 Tax=Ceratosolen solmsi marchali TaxID=326594 RepID=A0AAJ6YPS4_9HYME|nr:PREDICTED: solute carrier family 41 member 1-like [Ceratosolen solmsi marchali]